MNSITISLTKKVCGFYRKKSKPITIVVLLLLSATIAFVTLKAEVKQHSSDPRGTLLVSEAIAQEFTIKLDKYQPTLNDYTYRIHEHNGHFYYYFPLGSSVFSAPFMIIANSMGYSAVKDEPKIQNRLTALTSVCIFLLLYVIARLHLNELKSACVAALFWFGTSFSSIGATAMWSHNYAAIFSLLAIYIILIALAKKSELKWAALAICLFAAYFCRPTLALFIPFAYLSTWQISKKNTIKSGALLLGLLSSFVIFSYIEYSQILPDYYLPKRLSNNDFSTAFWGNLFSPARGLFVFTPFLLLPLLAIKSLKPTTTEKKIILTISLWPIIHLLVISRFPHWWGGWTFGPRLMLDVLPAFYLLTIATICQKTLTKLSILFLIVSSAFSVFVHSIQGLNNPYTARWNASPNIDAYPEYLFDWKYPQFLHSSQRHHSRTTSHMLALQKKREAPSMHYTFNSEDITFLGWSDAEANHRWSSGTRSEILFISPEISKVKGEFIFVGGALGQQLIRPFLNEVALKEFKLTTIGLDTEFTIAFKPGLLKAEEINVLRFEFPDATTPPNGDPRILALAIKEFSIR